MKTTRPLFRFLPLLAAALLALLLAACGPSAAERYAEQLDLGMQYLQQMDYEQAIVAFTAAIEIDPEQAGAYVGRAEAYMGGQNFAAAAADYTAALALDPEQDVYAGRGDAYYALGELELALADYGEELDRRPGQGALHLRRGEICYKLQQYPQAVEELEKALEYGPGDGADLVELYTMLGNAWLEQGDVAKAGDAFARGFAATGDETLRALAAQYEVVVWDDPVFEGIIRSELGLPDGPVMASQLDGVTMVYILGQHVMVVGDETTEWKFNGWFIPVQGTGYPFLYSGYVEPEGTYVEVAEPGGIKSVEALRYFHDLKRAWISFNQITDISVVEELEGVESVEFSFNDVEDMSPQERVNNRG